MLCHMALAMANWEGKRASKALEQADKVCMKPLPQMMPTVQGSERLAVCVVCQVMALTGRQEAFKPFYIRALQVLHTQTRAWLVIIDGLGLQPLSTPASLTDHAVMSTTLPLRCELMLSSLSADYRRYVSSCTARTAPTLSRSSDTDCTQRPCSPHSSTLHATSEADGLVMVWCWWYRRSLPMMRGTAWGRRLRPCPSARARRGTSSGASHSACWSE